MNINDPFGGYLKTNEVQVLLHINHVNLNHLVDTKQLSVASSRLVIIVFIVGRTLEEGAG